MKVKVLGSGCANCAALEQRTREALDQLGLDADVEKVEDMAQIMGYGVMTTPALVVDETVLLAGRVPDTDKIAQVISSVAPVADPASECADGNCPEGCC
jgi:small redox-active disulfide protein 2